MVRTDCLQAGFKLYICRYCAACQKQELSLDDWRRHRAVHLVPYNQLPRVDSSPPPRVNGPVNAIPVQGDLDNSTLRTVFGMQDNILIVELFESANRHHRTTSDLFEIFNRRRRQVRQVVATFMTQHPRIKMSLGLQSIFARHQGSDTGAEWQQIEDYTRTPTEELDNVDEALGRIYDHSVNFMWQYVENFLRNGSGWTFQRYKSIIIYLYALPPLAVGSWQRTPRELAQKHCIVNVDASDGFCFKWAIVSSVLNIECNHYQARVSTYYERRAAEWSHLNFDAITPGQLISGHTVALFEAANPNYALNLFLYVNMDAVLESHMRPGRLTVEEKRKRKELIKQFHVSQYVHSPTRKLINLLLLEHPLTGQYHAVNITNLNSFFNLTGSTSCKVCPKCLQRFTGPNAEHKQRVFEKHRDEFCADKRYDKYNVTFPQTSLAFNKTLSYSILAPFLIFGDFETFQDRDPNSTYNHDTPQQKIINRHRIMGYSLGVMTTPGVSDHLQSLFPQKTYCGEDAEQHFVADFTTLKDNLLTTIEELKSKYGVLKPRHQFTPEEEALAQATHCHICEEPITHHGRGWKRHQREWEQFLGEHGPLVVDDNSLPDNYWRGPRVVDHCHLR